MKTILFDMDGVLTATERMHYEALNFILRQKCGKYIKWEYYAQFIGSTNAHFWHTLQQDLKLSDVPALYTAYTARKQEILHRDGHKAVEGAQDLVYKLANQGYSMAVASSSPMGEIKEAMQALHLIKFFKIMVSGEQVENPKPAPDIFLYTAKQMGVAPEDCIVIEDSTNGVRAAKAAGMYCIGLRNLDSGNQDLSLADHIVDQLKDVPCFLI